MKRILCLTPVRHIRGVMDILRDCGEVHYYPDASKSTIKSLLVEVRPNAIFVNPNQMSFRLDESTLTSDIEVVSTASTGTNHIDLDYCNVNHIAVLSLTNDHHIIDKISSTAEMAFALMLSLIRNIPRASNAVKDAYIWEYMPFIGRQIDALTVGIIGFGRLGTLFADYCHAFKMNILVYDLYVKSSKYCNCDFDELLAKADVISLHVHLNSTTERMMNNAAYCRMKPSGCYLINTSRGQVVDETDTIKALEKGILLGYATDVIKDELGDVKQSDLIKASRKLNMIITPHIAGMTKEAQEIAYQASANKLFDYLKRKCND